MVGIITKISVKGQIVIPRVFRQEYGLHPGNRILIREERGRLLIEKPKTSLKEFLGATRRKFLQSRYTYSSHEYEEAMDHGES